MNESIFFPLALLCPCFSEDGCAQRILLMEEPERKKMVLYMGLMSRTIDESGK